jgi:hypothetical protein
LTQFQNHRQPKLWSAWHTRGASIRMELALQSEWLFSISGKLSTWSITIYWFGN